MSAIDGYISLNASHVNQIMKVLTIAAVIIVLLTFLLGNQWHEFREHPGTEIAPRWFPPVERDGHRPAAVVPLCPLVVWRIGHAPAAECDLIPGKRVQRLVLAT